MPLVSSGVEHGNLRELALARMKDLGTQCRDVRTREVGIQEIHHKVKPYEVCVLTRMFQGLRSSLIRVYTVCHSVCIVWTKGERGGSVVECRTPEREVRGSRPTAAVLCP